MNNSKSKPNPKITAVKIPVKEYLDIESALDYACYILSLDGHLDWEDRTEIHKKLIDSANALTTNRRQIESAINQEFRELAEVAQ